MSKCFYVADKDQSDEKIIIGIGFLIIDGDKSGITKNAQIILGSSEMYSAEEIQAAMDVVLIQFKEFPAVLNKLWYDEERSKIESKSWIEEYSAYDIIVLYSSFKTFKGEQARVSNYTQILADFEQKKVYLLKEMYLLRRNENGTCGYISEIKSEAQVPLCI